MKATRVLILLFLLWNWLPNVSAQTGDSISYQQYNDLLRIIENGKLRRIQKLIDSVGIAAPVQGEVMLKHSAITVSYNPQHRQANYVVHILPKDILFGNFTRSNDFRPDPLLKIPAADSADYWMSGYDRGHLAPSADFKWSKKALSESYLYSNISPQHPAFNQGAWSKLEMLTREWAIQNQEIIIITGPVLHDSLPKIPQGSKQLSVPAQFFKIALDYYPPDYKAIAFLYPNAPVPLRLPQHVVSIDSIEQLTGIDFFPQLEDSLEQVLEQQHALQDWEPDYKEEISDEELKAKSFGKGKINSFQAKDYIEKEACVCGKVVSTKYHQNGSSNPTYINLDKRFPDQVFTLIIYGSARKNFSYEPETYLVGKTVCVKGKVGQFKGTPQIIANREKDVEILKD